MKVKTRKVKVPGEMVEEMNPFHLMMREATLMMRQRNRKRKRKEDDDVRPETIDDAKPAIAKDDKKPETAKDDKNRFGMSASALWCCL